MTDRSLRLEIILAGIDKATAPFAKVQRGSRDLAKGLKEARDKLRALETTAGDADGFRKLEGDIVSTALELRKAREAAADLQRKFQDVEAPTKRLTGQFNRAREAVARLEAQQRDEISRLDGLKTKLESAGVSTGDLARHQDRLRNEIREANGAIDAQKRKLAELGERQGRASRAAGIIQAGGSKAGQALAVSAAAGAAATAVAVPLKNEYDVGAEFNSRMTDIRQKAGLTRVEGDKLAAQLKAGAVAANQLPPAMQDAADSLAGFGLDVPVAVRLTTPIGRTATAYKAEMEDLSKASFSVIDNLKVAANETELGKVLDAMAYAGKRGAFEIKDMAGAFPSLTANYQALGQTGVSAAADLAASLQIVRKGAGDSEEAANNLANVLQKIGSPETERKFAKMGVNLRQAMKDAAAAGKTPIEAIAEITNKAVGGDLSKLGYLFEDAQVQKGLRPLIQNLDELRSIRAGAMAAGGTVNKDFADRMLDDAEKAKALKIAAMDARLAFSSALAPVLTPLIDKIAEGARHFQAWTKEHPKLTAFLAKAAVWVGVLLAVVAAVALVVVPIIAFISALGGAAAALGVSVGAVALAIGAGIALVIAGVMAVIGAIKGWNRLAPIVSAAWNAVIERVRAAIAYIVALGVNFTRAGFDLMMGLVGGIKNGLGAVKDAITGAGGQVISWFKAKLGIRSPSRVFAGLGGHVMEGLDQGMDRGSAAPMERARRLAAGLTAAMAVTGPQVAIAGQVLASRPASVMANPAISVAARAPMAASIAAIESAQTDLAAPILVLARGPAESPALEGTGTAPVLRRPGAQGAMGPGAAARPINITINIHATPGMDLDALARKTADVVRQSLADEAPARSSANAHYGDDYV